ncbi:hypothetical protein H6G52_02545 [Limnothrix sp. FACHB-881]|uniref:hypothetical protein n=1 Tax=Limnothrix sp. FACHB-881 TaxID=2692819 RepID=UPI0016892676|nr:hypothetical protein [Limnothrix sp. FACHB-881]MBD2634229.1 hypothetical protein [Limnothrix sp. FACHB-881]
MSCVASREYKVILQANQFTDRAAGVDRFWLVVRNLAEGLGLKVTGELSELVKREVVFLDTPEHDLLDTGYIVRRRVELKAGKPARTKVMLKYRSPDRYIAWGADVSTPTLKGETKFEEDIVPPFRSQFSHSTSAVVESANWTTIGDLATNFPGVDSLELSASKPLTVVNQFVAKEFVQRGAIIDFGKQDAEVALTAWYVDPERQKQPSVVEFSFAYGEDAEDFSARSALRAKKLFDGLQALTDWYDPKAITKTQFAYQFSG